MIFLKIQRLQKKIGIIPEEEANRYARLFILAGYIFLGITIIDYVFILYPFQLFNPSWEFSVLEKIVESGWSPILAGIFLFYPHKFPVIRIEKIILTWLSRFFLVLAITYFLITPLILGNAYRISYQRDNQMEKKILEQNKKLNEIEEKINTSNLEQLNNFVRQNPTFNLPENKENLTEVKEILISQIKATQTAINEQEKLQIKQANSSLKKTGYKLVLKSILVGILLIGIWHYSAWVRMMFMNS